MAVSMLKAPRQYTPGMDKKALWFRHPWVIGEDKKGVLVRIGIAKLSRRDQGSLFDDLQKLLKASPKLKTDAPMVDVQVLQPYLDVIKRATPKQKNLDFTQPLRIKVLDPNSGNEFSVDLVSPLPTEDHMLYLCPPKGVTQDEFINAHVVVKAIKDELKRKDELLEAERREVERLQALVDRLNRTFGERSEAERKTLVGDCLKRFEKNYRVREGVSEAQQDDIIRRVKLVVGKLGLENQYGKLTEIDFVKAVTDTDPKSLRERARRIQAVRTFCQWLCRSRERGGMGFVANPVAELKPESDKKIQSKRRAEGLVSTLDPKAVMESLSDYWKTFVAVLGYAGLRRGEAAGLTWDAVDFTAHVIHVRANRFYPRLKSEASERPIPAFPELWPILGNYKKARGHPELVFPRLNWEKWENPCWLVPYKGRVKAYDLTSELADAFDNAKLSEKEPCRRLRRYWETRMRSEGYGQFVAQHAGHSDQVGASHYSDWNAIAKDLSAKMQADAQKKNTSKPKGGGATKMSAKGKKAT